MGLLSPFLLALPLYPLLWLPVSVVAVPVAAAQERHLDHKLYRDGDDPPP